MPFFESRPYPHPPTHFGGLVSVISDTGTPRFHIIIQWFVKGLLHTLCVCRDLAKAGKGGGAPSYFQDPPRYFVAPSLFNIVPPSF